MAENLSAFLAQNARKIDTVRYVASDRFTGPDGAPVPWEIGCITAAENSRIRQGCMKTAPGAKRGQTAQQFDAGLYQARIAARCTLSPDLNDRALQDSYGVHTAEELIATMLTPGEFEDYSAKVLEVNGFQTEAERIEEAKTDRGGRYGGELRLLLPPQAAASAARFPRARPV